MNTFLHFVPLRVGEFEVIKQAGVFGCNCKDNGAFIFWEGFGRFTLRSRDELGALNLSITYGDGRSGVWVLIARDRNGRQ